MTVLQAIVARLREPELSEESVSCVDMRLSNGALEDLLLELDPKRFSVMPTGKRSFVCCDILSTLAFDFRLDEKLPGKSFVMKLEK